MIVKHSTTIISFSVSSHVSYILTLYLLILFVCPLNSVICLHLFESNGYHSYSLSLTGYCAYLDAENAMDPMLAEAIGVDTKNLLVSCPDSAENMLSVVDKLTQSGSLDVIVIDSVSDNLLENLLSRLNLSAFLPQIVQFMKGRLLFSFFIFTECGAYI